MTAASVGRRDGAPRITTLADPATHPASTASTVSSETGVAMRWATATAMAAVHQARRQRREVQGVTAAVMATTPARAYADGPSRVMSPSHSWIWVTVAAELSASGCTSQNNGIEIATPTAMPAMSRQRRCTTASTPPMTTRPRPSSSPRATTTVTRPAGRRSRPPSRSAVNSDAVPPKKWLARAATTQGDPGDHEAQDVGRGPFDGGFRHGVGAGRRGAVHPRTIASAPPTSRPAPRPAVTSRGLCAPTYTRPSMTNIGTTKTAPAQLPGITSTTTQVTAATRMT